MQTLPLFILEIVISLGLSALILFVISNPLTHALNSACRSEQQAQFWLNYTRVMLFIAPLLLVITIGGALNGSALEHIRVALMCSLLGILISMMVVGSRLLSMNARNNKREF